MSNWNVLMNAKERLPQWKGPNYKNNIPADENLVLSRSNEFARDAEQPDLGSGLQMDFCIGIVDLLKMDYFLIVL